MLSKEKIRQMWVESLGEPASHSDAPKHAVLFADSIERAAREAAIERIEQLKRDHTNATGECTNASCDFVAAWDDAIRALSWEGS